MESVKEPRIEASQASLITAAPLPISVVTPEGRRIDTNLATERYFKRTREQIIGTEVGELYSKEDSEKIRDALEECKRVGSSSCEVTAIRGDNTNFPVILNFSSVKDEEGNIINVLVSATDVTELRKQEEELNETVSAFGEVLCKASNGDLSARVELNVIGEKYNPIGKNINSMIEGMSTYLQNIENSRAFFDSTLESIPVGLVLYKADDPDKKWYRTNPALEKMVGYGAEEMIGKRTEQQLFNTDEATKIFLEQTGCPTITKQSRDNIPCTHIKSNSSSHHRSTL
jgi:PAS domain S-box-containing protein